MATTTEPSAFNRKYDLLRKRATQEAQAQGQQENDALARRFAAQGMSGSGAAIKQEQLAGERTAKRVSDANQTIDMAQADEQMKIDEAEKNRKFATSEREAGQAFQSGVLKQQQDFQSLERQAAEAFSRGENDKARELQKAALDMQAKQFKEQMDLAMKQFDLDAYISAENLRTASQGKDIVLPPWMREMVFGKGSDNVGWSNGTKTIMTKEGMVIYDTPENRTAQAAR